MNAARFDAVARTLAVSTPRRRVLKVLAALGVGGVLLRPAGRVAARIPGCPEVKCPQGYGVWCEIDGLQCLCTCVKIQTGGIAGGGAVALGGGGEATLTLLATRTENPDRPGVFGAQGQVAWVDPAWEGTGLTLESVGIAFYGPLEGVEGGREVAGWLRADRAQCEHPFVLHAVDAGPPGSGQDTVVLWTGAAVLDDPALAGAFAATPEPEGFRYHAEGTLVAGDLRLVSLPSPTGEAAPATPVP